MGATASEELSHAGSQVEQSPAHIQHFVEVYGVVDKFSLPVRGDQAGLPQDAQVLGSQRLLDPQGLENLIDAYGIFAPDHADHADA